MSNKAANPPKKEEAAKKEMPSFPGKGDKDPRANERLVEDDDEFEEFEAENWDQKEDPADDEAHWADNWDDDDVDPAFLNQLRAQVEQAAQKK